MELTNEFRVAVSVERAWSILTDVERIAPCMPGADLQEIEGDEYRGVVKVKVGPITAQYKGKATFVERDEAGGRAVLRAEGRETRGQGNASATITATLRPDGDGTAVSVLTDLTISGKVAQFGRGVLAEVSGKLLNQFVACLETDVLREGGAPGDDAPAAAEPADPSPPPRALSGFDASAVKSAQSSGDGNGDGGGGGGAQAQVPSAVRQVESRPSEPVDLLGTAGAPVAKRAAPVVALVFLAAWLLRRRRRRARRSR